MTHARTCMPTCLTCWLKYISLWYQDKYLDETPNYIQTWGKIKHQSAFTFLKFCAFRSLLLQKAEKKEISLLAQYSKVKNI